MKLIQKIKPYGRLVKAFIGYFYDFTRFIRFGGWSKNLRMKELRNFHVAKTYHAVEKSMAFRPRRVGAGWSNVDLLADACISANNSGNIGYHDRVGVSVLDGFVSQDGNRDHPGANKIRLLLNEMYSGDNAAHGDQMLTEEKILSGQLENPEQFFLTRYSLRDFASTTVDNDKLERAMLLAAKAPSACNRQPWMVYHTVDPQKRDAALALQAGNRGFGQKIPNLLIVTADLRAFMPGEERYQVWIDGGIFSMSLIQAFHSLGIGTCCLNWSVSPKRDKQLRKLFNIDPSHTIIMMLAVGYPKSENFVCVSKRRPIDTFLKELEFSS